ncbi:probable carnitine transport protein [Phialocephala subalpina]|uniref:Probable carnitine transport protein n=1 Tax=Phialocephala subalpina TaxID=576137 RepID=A0A1L7X7E1_9HELO|nr:probable carnitine transport protein [Phialocephala subalpina]
MASTGVEIPGSAGADYIVHEKHQDHAGFSREKHEEAQLQSYDSSSINSVHAGGFYDSTHRQLRPRHIQLIGIGGTIGTALYVHGLLNGGPASLFMAFTIWCAFILVVTNCMSEMVTYLPISSPFIRFAGRYVDEAFGVAAGYNIFIFEAALVPFEIVACNVIIHYWSDVVPAGGIIAIVIVSYGIINVFAVKWYGESEFWLAMGKVLLIIGLIIFTLIAMVGGNPLHDKFGFRYWGNPGAFVELYYEGNLGRFLGFLQCLIQASFTIAGPDYVSMGAGEAENPRKVMPQAYNAVFYRLTAFFVLGSLAVGILVPHNGAELSAAFKNGLPGAAASPYVVAMNRLKIRVLPDIVNSMVLASAFSAGNSYVYCASRSLFGLALEGKARKFLTKCTKSGVPIYCVAVTLAIALLSFLQVSNNAAVVLNWFVSLVTASQLINFSVMAFTFIAWKRACDAQGLDRDTLPHKSFWQPFSAYYALTGCFIMTFVGGYTVFLPGQWDVPTFLFSYLMVFLFPVIFIAWKVIKKTNWLKPHEVILRSPENDEIDEYTRNYVELVPKTRWHGYVDRMFS